MSASSLPSELWRSILRYAVHVPALLDTDWYHDPDERLWVGWGVTKDEISTKRAIVKVCRAWKELGMEFLHEHISLQMDVRDAGNRTDRLVEEFQTSATASSLGYGWWTKRIDCAASILNSERMEQVFTLLELCHNLQIFSVPSYGNVATSVQIRLARTLQSRFSHSLRRVDLALRGEDAGVPIDHTLVLPNVPLTSLSIMLREPYPDRSPHPSFEAVTTLTLHLPIKINTSPLHLFFPHLRTLAVLRLGTSDINAVIPFMKRHCDTLITLFIETADATIPNLPDLIAENMHLRNFCLDEEDLQNLGDSAREGMLSAISHLGVTRFRETEGLEYFWPGLETLLKKRSLPDLRVIRLLAFTSPVSHDIDGWREVIQKCQEYNVRLEDKDRRLVAVLDLDHVQS